VSSEPGAAHFNLSVKETRIAKTLRPERVPTLEQIRHVIRSMPGDTEVQRRDRALIAFTILTGARDGAIASLKLARIDIDAGHVDQDARQVKTKFSKSFVTTFFPVGDDIRTVISAKGQTMGFERSAFPCHESCCRR
jgi:integrase